MGQPKTPGTMLQNGYTDTNVLKVLAAGTCPQTNLSISHRSWQGLLSLDKPGAAGAGLRCYKWRTELFAGFYRLPTETCTRAYSSNTLLIVLAISLFVGVFIAKAFIPFALAA